MTQEASQAPISGVDAVMKESSAQIYWVRRVIAFVIDAFIVYFARARTSRGGRRSAERARF